MSNMFSKIKRNKLYKILFTLLLLTVISVGSFLYIRIEEVSAQQGYNLEVHPAKSHLYYDPGTTNSFTLTVRNYSGGLRKVYLYVQDFTVLSETGAPEFIDPKEPNEKYSLRAWVDIPYESIELEDKEEREVEITVDVPEDAEPGGHYGAVFVQTENPASTGTSIGSVGRFASLMLVYITGDVTENIDLTQAYTDKKVYLDANPDIEFITYLKNTGNVHGVPIGAFMVSGGYAHKPQSITYNKNQGAVMPGAPDRKIDEIFKLKNEGMIPPLGKFQLDLIARYGTQNYPIETTLYFWVLPWKFLTITILAALFILFITWRALVSFKQPRK